jgi:uncharacterized protein (DUF885 family)
MNRTSYPRLTVSLFAVIVTLTSCSAPTQKEQTSGLQLSMDSVANDYFEEYARLYPLQSTFFGDNRFDDQFEIEIGNSFRKKAKDFYSRYKSLLQSFNYDSLSANDKTTYDVLLWQCDIQLEGFKFNNHLTPVDQFNSVNLIMTDLATGAGAQPFKTAKDYENWLSRLNKYVAWCDTAIINMKKGIAEKYVLPKVLVEKAIPQWEEFSKGPAEDHLFFSPARNFPSGFSAEEKDRLRDAYAKMVEEKIIPAYRKMTEFLRTEYLPSAVTSSGLGDRPGGKEYYAYLVKNNTTTDLNADSIFELGMSEVKRILKETEEIKKQVNFNGDLQAFFNHLRTRKGLMPFTKPEQVIANFNAIHEKMKPHLKKLFRNTPKTAFEIRRTPAFREATSSAEYFVGSQDGSRPGIFYVPIPDVTKYNVLRDESLFLHEAIPGHHYQFALQMENQDLPAIRRRISFDAYAEGWALYTESLGKELGLYTDPYQYLGMLGAEMHRAIRLVVDAGIHAKGWTREQAIQFSKEHEALPEQGIIAEIERYMAMPGQALSYKIGQLKIRELRARAEKELGSKFNVADFHDQVLDSGNLPLAVLDGKIRRWIASQKQ